jgi:hypothetical protein
MNEQERKGSSQDHRIEPSETRFQGKNGRPRFETRFRAPASLPSTL